MRETIIARCEAQGLRLTEQRRVIARVLESAADHPDAEELHARAAARDARISLATVYRTVKLFERNGAAVIQLEDQSLPKRCGHLSGKTLVSAAEMVGKIKAAVDARRSQDTLIMARTDAIAVEGLDAALERAERYHEAGADILFVEAPRDLDEMRTVTDRLGGKAPLLANMVEGGKTPIRPAGELQEIGYSIVIFPGGLARAVGHLMGRYFASLQAHGDTSQFRAQMIDFDEMNALIGTPEMLANGERFDAANFEAGDDA